VPGQKHSIVCIVQNSVTLMAIGEPPNLAQRGLCQSVKMVTAPIVYPAPVSGASAVSPTQASAECGSSSTRDCALHATVMLFPERWIAPTMIN
jgi:hypothetical protein